MRGFRRKLGRKLGPMALVAIAAFGAVLTAGTAVVTTHGTCTVAGFDINCDIGDLKAGESATVEVVVQPTMAGLLKNTAIVSGDQFDTNPNNNMDMEETVVIDPEVDEGIVDLKVVKVDSQDPAYVNEDFSYTIEVSNIGTGKATNVDLKDTLPLGVDFVSSSGADCSQGIGLGVHCLLGTLVPGESKTITITVNPTSVGSVFNQACACADQEDANEMNNCDEETTDIKVREVDLQVTKSDDKDPIKVGEDLTYTVVVTNNGPDDATGVVLKDSITQPLD